ncbi:MAG UNVERIFIED_CONTAM: twin-arginine translocation signal domain-containing protein [Planctomycetaceae bacterium]|jgi:hypothetical protein
MKRHRPCGSKEHGCSRRAFLSQTGLAAAGLATGLGDILTARTAIAQQVQAKSRRVLNIFLRWRCQPVRDMGPQAQHGHWRAISGNFDFRAWSSDL